jgi:hypothetical protein
MLVKWTARFRIIANGMRLIIYYRGNRPVLKTVACYRTLFRRSSTASLVIILDVSTMAVSMPIGLCALIKLASGNCSGGGLVLQLGGGDGRQVGASASKQFFDTVSPTCEIWGTHCFYL